MWGNLSHYLSSLSLKKELLQIKTKYIVDFLMQAFALSLSLATSFLPIDPLIVPYSNICC